MFSHILSPIDGSETAFRVAEYAMNFAQKEGAQISLLFVINERNVQRISSFSDKNYDILVEQFKDQGNKYFQALKRQGQKETSNLNVIEVIRVGEPSEEIIKYAVENSVDLIIIPMKDEDHSAKINLGHVTDRVIQAASVPVMAIPYKYLTKSD